jgi:hypothetical protein
MKSQRLPEQEPHSGNLQPLSTTEFISGVCFIIVLRILQQTGTFDGLLHTLAQNLPGGYRTAAFV